MAELENLDYRHRQLSQTNFSHLSFEKVDFTGANLAGTTFENSLFRHCDFTNANLKDVNFVGADLRTCRLSGANITGANFYYAMLEDVALDNVFWDETTQYFRLHPPKTGAFLGYKKCFGYRIVQLLIPENAQRTSATGNSCRCNLAKVLTIKDMYTNQDYDEAISYVDPDFIYRRGAWVYAKNFNPNRWADSTGGIHFWLTRKEAEDYL